ncbi:SET domain-containing protein [Pseudomonas sp. MWU12-2037]|uniref:SET domain-containing protein n=1 Tax=Pseudomonas sp. MWU12-2037 TaxID=2928690 RepID=UPI0020103819|nr:SET domain-containing protein [Pseudomonas sp. MWU12-2037]
MPPWLLLASREQRDALRQSLIASSNSRHEVRQMMAKLQSPVQFVKPLLEHAITVNFQLTLDVEQATFVHEHKNDYFFGLISVQGTTTEQTLLSAALHNFDESLASAEAFGAGSGIYLTSGARDGKTPIKPEEFALVCRNLDFGSLYQSHLRSILSEPAQPDGAVDSSTQDALIRSYKDAFAVAIHLAILQHEISVASHRVLLDVLQDRYVVRYGTQACSLLEFLGMDVSEVLVIGLDAEDGTNPCIVYIPQDPIRPLARYGSIKDFEDELNRRLLSPGYRQFFSRFLPLSHQGKLLDQMIRRALRQKWAPKTGPVPWPNPVFLALHPIKGNVFKSLRDRRVRQIERHGREVVVPTADIDTQARQELREAYAKAGFSALLLAASFIPVIGDILLIFTGAQLIQEAYLGFDAWRRDEKVEALNYLMDVAEQVAFMGASAGAVKAGRFVNSLLPVKLSSNRFGLWKEDLSPYRQSLELPETLLPDEQGLYHYQGKHYLSLDEQLYEVGTFGPPSGWSIRHPDDPWAYSPPLLQNGSGAWRTVHERPQDWSDLKRLRRLGPVATGTQPEDLAPILHASASDSNLLLELHRENQAPPAQLIDTLKRFQLDRKLQHQRLLGSPPDNDSAALSLTSRQHTSEQFEDLYQQSEQIEGPLPEQIRQDFPDLPKSYVQAMEKSISPAEARQILDQKGLLPYLKDEAELSLQSVDTARLHEGLYLHTTFNPDSDLLAFQTLEALPGWSGNVRLELYSQTLVEPPAASVGNDSATTVRRLLREGSRYRVYDADGEQILAPSDLYSAIGQALPETELDNLGFSGPNRNNVLKQSLAHRITQLSTSPVIVRRIPASLRSRSYPPGNALDIHFAQETSPSDLTPIGDGLYRGALSRHYIEEEGRYYQVESSDLGWKLIDARNPFRCYRPVLQRRDGHWEINTAIGLKGGAPGPGHSKIQLVESETTMVSALEYVKPEPFTREDLLRMKAIKSYQRQPNRMGEYDRVNNGRYPLRDLSGNPLRIRKIQHMSEITDSGVRYQAKDILPYLKWENHEAVAQLYEEKLLLRQFTAEDAKFPQESSMIGQAMVVARRPLKAGEAIGVYGGNFIPFHVSNARRDPFVIDVLPGPLPDKPTWDRLVLTGDNIISRINSIFEYEGRLPVRQAGSGYNVEGASFPVDVEIAEGRLEPFVLSGFFTTRDIPADEELRWNYGYSEAGTRITFAAPETSLETPSPSQPPSSQE